MAAGKGEESKKKLLKAAEKLFAEKGFQSTKVSEIVAHAGLTQAAFYLYFASKEEILQHLLSEFEQQLGNFGDAGKKAGDFYPGRVQPYVKDQFVQLFSFLGKNPSLTKIALHHGKHGDRIREKIVAQIAGNMKENQNKGIVKKEIDPQIASEAIVAVTERLIDRYLWNGEKTKEELGAQAAQIFLHGILNES